jgi:hypothetical protein
LKVEAANIAIVSPLLIFEEEKIEINDHSLKLGQVSLKKLGGHITKIPSIFL